MTGTPVVDLRRGPDTVGALAEKNLVDVELEDLVLGEFTLDLQRKQNLVELADVGLLAAEEEIPGDLHGDGAAPRPLLPGTDEVEQGTGQTLPVDAGMLEEPVVLACEKGLDQTLGNFIEAQRLTALLAELGEELALAGIDPQRDLQPYVAEGLRRREFRRQIPVGTADAKRYGKHRQQHEDAEDPDCAGESNHGLCSARTHGRPVVNRAPRGG